MEQEGPTSDRHLRPRDRPKDCAESLTTTLVVRSLSIQIAHPRFGFQHRLNTNVVLAIPTSNRPGKGPKLLQLVQATLELQLQIPHRRVVTALTARGYFSRITAKWRDYGIQCNTSFSDPLLQIFNCIEPRHMTAGPGPGRDTVLVFEDLGADDLDFLSIIHHVDGMLAVMDLRTSLCRLLDSRQ